MAYSTSFSSGPSERTSSVWIQNLIQQAYRLHGQHHDRTETDRRKPTNGSHSQNTNPVSVPVPLCRNAVDRLYRLGGVTYDVRCPEQAAFMAHSVEPVVAEFIREKEQHPQPPLVAEGE